MGKSNRDTNVGIGRHLRALFSIALVNIVLFAHEAGAQMRTNPPVAASGIPTARINSRAKFGLSDSIRVDIDGSASQLQAFTGDVKKVVLLVDGIPLRGMATNIVLATNTTLSTNITVRTNIMMVTNVTSLGAAISHTPTIVTNADRRGHFGTIRIEFVLERTEGNKGEWNQLLGSPRVMVRPVHIEVGIETNNTIMVLAKVSGPASEFIILRNEPFFKASRTIYSAAILGVICFGAIVLRLLSQKSFGDLFKGWWSFLWIGVLWAIFACFGGVVSFLAFILIFFTGFLYLANTTEILRDSGPIPPKDKHRTYSLARFQMAVWFFLVVCAFVFLWMITDTLNTVTGTVLALMGIGAGTALGAEAQNKPKIATMKERIAVLKAKTPLSEDENCELKRLTVLTLDVPCVERELKRLRDIIQTIQTGPDEATLKQQRDQLRAQASLDVAQSAALSRVEELLRQWTDLLLYKSKVAEIESLLDNRPISKGFFEDILTDDVGISFHRFQMFTWTIVLGIVFIFSVYRQLTMPQFSDTLLALMGISSGTYLGFMFAEAPSGMQSK